MKPQPYNEKSNVVAQSINQYFKKEMRGCLVPQKQINLIILFLLCDPCVHYIFTVLFRHLLLHTEGLISLARQ